MPARTLSTINDFSNSAIALMITRMALPRGPVCIDGLALRLELDAEFAEFV
jgi:hypothetical protein